MDHSIYYFVVRDIALYLAAVSVAALLWHHVAKKEKGEIDLLCEDFC